MVKPGGGPGNSVIPNASTDSPVHDYGEMCPECAAQSDPSSTMYCANCGAPLKPGSMYISGDQGVYCSTDCMISSEKGV